MEGGLYRFQGTSANNYICFGTSTKSTCTGNTDAYMYRILGINSSGQLKLIKKEALNTAYYWHNTDLNNTTWPNSDLYKGINGISGGQYSNLFIGNTTYVSSTWSGKIATTTWKYGTNVQEGTSASSLYEKENAWSTTTSAKIGLLYLHEYYYGISGGNNCSSSSYSSSCKSSWLHLSNNDSDNLYSAEWTMSGYGYVNGGFSAYVIGSNGRISTSNMHYSSSVRPVFFLTSDVSYVSGTGTLADPIIIN